MTVTPSEQTAALAGQTDIQLQEQMGRQSNRSFAPRHSGAVDESSTPNPDNMDEHEAMLMKRDGKILMICWYIYEMNCLFGYQTLIICLGVFYGAAAESDQTSVIDLLLPINTAALVGTHLFNMCIDINSIFKPYVVMRASAIGLLVTYVVMGIFRSHPWVVVVCGIFSAVFSSSAEPPLWVMSTYFPNGEALRGMISAGNGCAGLIAVILQTIIRAIVYAVSDATTDATKIYFWIFFGTFYAMLFVSFAIAWFVPKMETFRYFEAKAIAMQKGEDQEAVPLMSDSGEVVAPKKQPKGLFRFLSWSFLSDISLPVCLIFASLFSTLLVWPFMATAYSSDAQWGNPQITFDSGDVKMLALADQGWPFNNESMVKWWWSPFVVGAFNLADFIGRYIPGMYNWIKYFPLWFCRILASARAAFVVLMVCCISPDIGMNSSLLFIVFVFFLGFSNGVVTTACFITGPTLAKEHKRPDAGSVHVLLLFLGISGGYFASEPFTRWCIHDGKAALIFGGVITAVLPWISFVGGLLLKPCNAKRSAEMDYDVKSQQPARRSLKD